MAYLRDERRLQIFRRQIHHAEFQVPAAFLSL